MSREIELKLKTSVKDYRMLNYDDMRRLVRRENSLRLLKSVHTYGVQLFTEQKQGLMVVEVKSLNTIQFDNLSTALRTYFDDYDIIHDKKFIRVEAKYYYGD